MGSGHIHQNIQPHPCKQEERGAQAHVLLAHKDQGRDARDLFLTQDYHAEILVAFVLYRRLLTQLFYSLN